MEKIFVVKKVAEQLWAAENAIDSAIADTARLMGGLVEARQDLQVSHIVTDAATGRIAESMAALAQARTAMVDAHHALYEAKLRIGVRTKLDGSGYPSLDYHDDLRARSAETGGAQRRAS